MGAGGELLERLDGTRTLCWVSVALFLIESKPPSLCFRAPLWVGIDNIGEKRALARTSLPPICNSISGYQGQYLLSFFIYPDVAGRHG